MRASIWFAPKVIETMRYYKYGRDELHSVERLLEDKPLRGREFVEGLPAIRALNKLMEKQPLTLTWQYLFAPLADFLPNVEHDGIVVFDVGGPVLATRKILPTYELESLKQEIIEICNAVRVAV